ncbi:hypothetical protein VL15_03755 [Burkholderia cepacia]|uniref:NIPSNAP domain-containing protein n=2 Tax=Burkholderia cepacia TaxID=292 RepID=A0A0J6A962_BURCE|nr:hypothetical protein VL15_03755 [Burkholderia cepacia]
MLHLVYTMQPTLNARRNLTAFWQWVKQREAWFYDGLDMAMNPQWRVQTIGPRVHALEHSISFADEAAWGTYRRAVAQRSRDPEWERRRVEQDEWWELIDARILTDAPLPQSE